MSAARIDEATLRRSVMVASPLAVLLAWQVLSAARVFPPEVLVSPQAVLAAFGQLTASGELARHLGESLQRLLWGFSIGSGAGLLFGLAAALSPTFARLFDPLFQALRQVPVLAFIPLLILLFGIDEVFKIVIIAKAAFFPTALSTLDGVRGVPKAWFEVARIYRTPLPSLVWRVLIPATVPAVLSGVRLSLTRAWLVLVAAELIVADSGIGQMMEMGRQMFRLDVVMVGVVVCGVIGFALDRGFVLLQARLLRWRAQPAGAAA
ncbi:ABC transporter permease [Methyloversatilis universalis]|uniref:ABC transporter permease n=1 Tax=Methyloversatilis universalis TaxID=378211 RepID=UPI00037D1D3A|nr:ABC transporter permease [Methyloversatilis universalis]